jgi:bifunctional UDP-N-acetylglucosamine pyrophosphorylase/glucosamine-1-phosphate N-acetyltransferase
MPLSVLILAAGQGKRMNSDLPKVLQPLAGRPLLGHVLDAAAALGPAGVHVVYGHGGERVRAAFSGDTHGASPLHWALQAEQLGTGHAVAQAMPAIDDRQLVLVLYGDVPLVRRETLQTLIALAGPRSLALLTVMLDDPAGYGRIVRNAAGDVQAIVEHKDASDAQRAIREGNSGILAAPAALLKRWLGQLKSDNAQGEYYLTDVIAMAVRDGIAVRPLVAPTLAEVLGVNDKLQLAQLEGLYRRQRAEALMRAGVTVIDPARLDVRGEVTVGRDVQLDVNVVLEGPVHLGDGVRVGPNCVISASRIGAGTEIRPNCVIERAEIGARCQIGPFSRVRPEARLAEGVHLGNFVEIKKSDIGRGSKVNHLSYIGDSTVGSGVNVGAGTITCNYDGVNKWRTEIGDDVFIGSGSMLVAPVKIGDGATIGAGSTITRDAPGQRLTLERSKQLTIDKWQRPTKKA